MFRHRRCLLQHPDTFWDTPAELGKARGATQHSTDVPRPPSAPKNAAAGQLKEAEAKISGKSYKKLPTLCGVCHGQRVNTVVPAGEGEQRCRHCPAHVGSGVHPTRHTRPAHHWFLGCHQLRWVTFWGRARSEPGSVLLSVEQGEKCRSPNAEVAGGSTCAGWG